MPAQQKHPFAANTYLVNAFPRISLGVAYGIASIQTQQSTCQLRKISHILLQIFIRILTIDNHVRDV